MDKNRNPELEQLSESDVSATTDSANAPNQTNEQISAAAPLTDQALCPAETDEEDELHSVDQEPEDDDAPVDMVFGLKRRTFHLVVAGYALGIIVMGLLGLAGIYDNNGSGTLFPGIIGGVLGYALAFYLDQRDAEKASNSAENRKG